MGFAQFAVETQLQFTLDQFTRTGVMHGNIASFAFEWAYVAVIREARRLRFKLMAFDTPSDELLNLVLAHMLSHSAQNFAQQNLWRERHMAEEIAQLLKRTPTTRVVVWGRVISTC